MINNLQKHNQLLSKIHEIIEDGGDYDQLYDLLEEIYAYLNEIKINECDHNKKEDLQ